MLEAADAMQMEQLVWLQQPYGDAEDQGSAVGSCTFALRIAAMFVILGAGLLGVLPPVVSTWITRSPDSAAARLIKAYAGGIILALSLVHIIPEAYEQLAGVSGPFPWGGVTVIAGLFIMITVEHVASWLTTRMQAHSSLQEPLLPAAAQHDAAGRPVTPEHAHEASEPCNKLCKASSSTAAAAAQEAAALAGPHAVLDLVPSTAHSGHICMQQRACNTAAVKQQVVCTTMELGCVLHSLVLGLALGIINDSTRAVVTLTAVLTVHQAIEGVALGSVLAATRRLARGKKLLCAVLYAFTLPAGIAAGLVLAGSYDPESPRTMLVQGIANGVSGGMLLYVSLLNLLVPELTPPDLLHRPMLGAAVLLGVVFGAAVMCVLGVWA